MSSILDNALNTCKVKLRNDKFASLRTAVTNGCDAGDFIQPFATAGIVGVAVQDCEAGEKTTIIYKAEKIILPCNFSGAILAGEPVGVNLTTMELEEISSLTCDIVVGIMTEDSDANATECEIDLLGFVTPICVYDCVGS